MTKQELIQSFVALFDVKSEAETKWFSDALDRYAYHVGMEAMGEPIGEYFFADVGFNLHRLQAIAKLKELTNQ